MCKHKACHAAALLDTVLKTFPNQEEAILGLTALTTMLLASLPKERRLEVLNEKKIEKYTEELSGEIAAKLGNILERVMKNAPSKSDEKFDPSEMMNVEELRRMFATASPDVRH